MSETDKRQPGPLSARIRGGYLMGILTKRNACRGDLMLAFVALVVLVGFQSVFSESVDQGIEKRRHAAEQGNASAQYNLGLMYDTGEGVLENYVKAYAWLNLAAAQGDKGAVEFKDCLRSKMTAEQVAEDQKLCRRIVGPRRICEI